MNIKYSPAGDQGILMNFGNEISESTNRTIRSMIDKLNTTHIKGVLEVIPSYTSLLVLYDRHKTSYSKLCRNLEIQAAGINETVRTGKKIHYIPVCYEDKYALDTQDVANINNLSTNEVIDIHTGTDYLIYMLGFMPGFVYLGGMDDRIACPRLETPRTKIPSGCVGIGGKQTGIYPLESPGGWRIIGQTPLKVYDPNRAPSIIYEMGEYIRFVAISSKEYDEIAEAVEKGTYSHRVEEIKL